MNFGVRLIALHSLVYSYPDLGLDAVVQYIDMIPSIYITPCMHNNQIMQMQCTLYNIQP
jgi:hypothetical protein